MPEPTPGVLMGTRLYTEPGFLVVAYDGQKSQLAIADILRAADIPIRTYEQLGLAFKAMVNLYSVLIRTLIARGVLDESFLEDGQFDLSIIVKTIEDMGGDFGEPDLTVT